MPEDSNAALLPIQGLNVALDERDPILARIVAIADTYDAMARLRTYGDPLPHVRIMRELQRVAGGQHDAYLSAKFSVALENSPFQVNGS